MPISMPWLRAQTPVIHVPAVAVQCSSLGTQVQTSVQQILAAEGFPLCAGTTFLISPYLMHRDKSAWGTTALDFDPDRWRTVRADKPLGCLDLMQGLGHNGSFLPFGELCLFELLCDEGGACTVACTKPAS